MEQKIKEIMASVFGMNVSDIGDSASASNIEVWDSLKQMDLVMALEEEFNIEFDDEDLIVNTYSELVQIVKRYL